MSSVFWQGRHYVSWCILCFAIILLFDQVTSFQWFLFFSIQLFGNSIQTCHGNIRNTWKDISLLLKLTIRLLKFKSRHCYLSNTWETGDLLINKYYDFCCELLTCISLVDSFHHRVACSSSLCHSLTTLFLLFLSPVPSSSWVHLLIHWGYLLI